MVAGEIVAGPHVRNACHRHIADLKRKDGIWFDHDAANHAFAFFEEVLKLSEGQFEGDRGMDWVQLSISPEDAQMLQSRAFSVEEVCRFFGVPPFMVGHTEKTTSWGTGLEQQTLGFQKFTLRRRLKRIEQALAKQLLSPADRQAGLVIEFNLEGLLRGDSAARASFYQQMLTNGVMTINEVRALENLPPVEGGDVPRMQMQNVPISQAGLLLPTGAIAPSEPPK